MTTTSPRAALGFLARPADERLRTAALIGGVALAVTVALPQDVVDDRLQFVWQILPELGLAGALASLSVPIAGVAVLVGRFALKRSAAFAMWVLGALLTAALWSKLGADAADWDMISVSNGIGQRSPVLIFGLSAVAAGLRLLAHSSTQRFGRITLGIAAFALLLFYVWPSPEGAPIVTLFDLLMDVFALPDVRYVLGHLLFASFLIFPLAMAVLAVVRAVRPGPFSRALPLLPTFGLPALLLVLVFRSLLVTLGDTSIVAIAGFAAALAAMTELSSTALEVTGSAWAEYLEKRKEAPPLLRLSWVTGSAVVLLALPQAWFARPPVKGVDWTLGPGSELGDSVFGERLTTWNQARFKWNLATRGQTSATQMVEMQAAARELSGGAREFDPAVAVAVKRLVVESRDMDLAGRRWSRLIAGVNAANRGAELPYYLDPQVSMRPTAEGFERYFSVNGYRIEAVKPVDVDGSRFATLQVSRLGEARTRHGMLGFSRDWQPFALVVRDEIEENVAQMTALGAHEPPTCDTKKDGEPAAPTSRASEVCGEMLRVFVVGTTPLSEIVARITERHELQHQIDGPHLVMARAVSERLGGVREDSRERVNRELSAYVAEMTHPVASPKLSLFWLLRFGAAGGIGVNAQVSALAFSALESNPIGGDGLRVDPASIRNSFLRLVALDDAELRRRAARAWRRLFGGRLERVTPLD